MLSKALRVTIAVTWELPQTIVACFLLLFIKICGKSLALTWNGRNWQVSYDFELIDGVALGPFAMLGNHYANWRNVIKHENGHTEQSLLLGPLYLPVVALPSVTMNLLTRAKILRRDRYYLRWPENWANDLGGVSNNDL